MDEGFGIVATLGRPDFYYDGFHGRKRNSPESVFQLSV